MSLTIHTQPEPVRMDDGGNLRVGRTRVTLDVVVANYREGATAEEIAECFDVLTPADVHAALAYYLRHQAEIDSYLADLDRQADAALKAMGDQYQPWSVVRDRLARRIGENAERESQ